MQVLAGHAASWVGTNGFRLMADDPLHTAEATATVTTAAGANVATIAYAWEHPADGRQDGLLMVGTDAGGVTAMWGDSWHQSPAAQLLHGAVTDGVIAVSCTYAGDWGWQIAVDAREPGRLLLQMHNVIPESAGKTAGAYPVMVMELRPA
jgi:hypothetical protein